MSDTISTLEDRLRVTLETVADLPVGSVERNSVEAHATPHRWRGLIVATGLAAGIAVVLAATLVPSGHSGHRPAALKPDAIHLIAQSSAVKLDSGKAHMNIVQSYAGAPIPRPIGPTGSPTHGVTVLPTTNTWSVDIAFSAANLSETVTQSESAPFVVPGSNTGIRSSTTYGMALISGIVYRQISGTWYREAAKATTNLLAVPTPTTFLAALTPAAQLVPHGKDRDTGWEEIDARNPQAASTALNKQIVGLAGGTVSSLTIWIDAHNVVHRMAWATKAPPVATCLTPSTTTQADGSAKGNDQTCIGGLPETQTVDITFTDLGIPQSITPPATALPGYGPFDDPNG